jgi:aromatic ring-opening dioxygenase LigB subunit
MIVFGAIAPHGGLVLEGESPTRTALEELGRRHAASAPDVTVVLTPHNVHVQGAFAVVTAATIAGQLEDSDARLSCPVDHGLAQAVVEALHEVGPAVGVSFGSNFPELAEMPMDWGTLVPLWFIGGRADPPIPVVVVSPAREFSFEAHVRAGNAIAAAAGDRRVAMIASADHGHAHDEDGPFGFHVAAAEYDARMVELVRENRLGEAIALGTIVDVAKADSLWQVLMLHGALGEGFDAHLLSYEVPTYFGMLCAAFEPRG